MAMHNSRGEQLDCAVGTLTQNDMTVTRAWIAGRFVDDVGSYSPWNQGSNGDGGTDLAAKLDPRVVKQLNAAIAVNCSASLRKQEGTGGLHLLNPKP